jgi:hypothetical protein
VDGKTPEFLAFWLREGRVLAGMNVNIWDVQNDIQRLVRAGFAGHAVPTARLTDPAVPLADLVPVDCKGTLLPPYGNKVPLHARGVVRLTG